MRTHHPFVFPSKTDNFCLCWFTKMHSQGQRRPSPISFRRTTGFTTSHFSYRRYIFFITKQIPWCESLHLPLEPWLLPKPLPLARMSPSRPSEWWVLLLLPPPRYGKWKLRQKAFGLDPGSGNFRGRHDKSQMNGIHPEDSKEFTSVIVVDFDRLVILLSLCRLQNWTLAIMRI